MHPFAHKSINASDAQVISIKINLISAIHYNFDQIFGAIGKRCYQ